MTTILISIIVGAVAGFLAGVKNAKKAQAIKDAIK